MTEKSEPRHRWPLFNDGGYNPYRFVCRFHGWDVWREVLTSGKNIFVLSTPDRNTYFSVGRTGRLDREDYVGTRVTEQAPLSEGRNPVMTFDQEVELLGAIEALRSGSGEGESYE